MTPAIRLLRRHRVEFEVHRYEHDPLCEAYGLEAATKLGLDASQVFKTLIVGIPGSRPEYTVAIIQVDRTLDLKAVAALRGGKKAEMADPAVARKLTGYRIGGISPLAQKRLLPTLLDRRAMEFAAIYVSGGQRGLDIELAPGDLQRLTDARVAPIARPESPSQ